ncbi:hypothetical protein RI367_002025 [Sorochytrium milnesiophthora]
MTAPISQRDNNVLNLIFAPDQHFPPSEEIPVDPSTTVAARALAALSEQDRAKLKKIEVEGIAAAEKGNASDAIALFTQCIDICPQYASVYNNRAQAYRLSNDLGRALEDLNAAVEYGVGDPHVLKQAYTQRAVVYKAMGQTERSLADFQRGAQYGNSVARVAAVKENPYAQLCNSIMSEVMGNYTKGVQGADGSCSKEQQ